MTVLVDTNVILVANGQHDAVSGDCVATCALTLQSIMLKERIALDSDCAILQEYQNKTKPFTGNRAGDAFVKWAIQNQANIERCDVVPLEPNEQRMFESFPDDERLSNFDASDRKFVAVAAAHPDHPKILQAADSKWIDWAPALADHEIEVEFLCPADIHRFHRNKFGR